MTDKNYDWIVIGGGIAGIAISEILCREQKSVLLIEKNNQVASETTKLFHEWLHTGALYSLVPDNLFTTRYLLGAIDDLFQFYQNYYGMNLNKSDSGIVIKENIDRNWFNNDFIQFRYKIRKFNPPWMSLVSRSTNIINLINNHDWLRRNAGGSEYGRSKIKFNYSFDHILKQIFSNNNFFLVNSPDFTMNSRILLNDLISSAYNNGLSVVTSEEVKNINEINKSVLVETSINQYKSKNVVICSPDVISKNFNIPINTGYAPMAIVENVPENERSFVELDYDTRSCINLLKKGNGIGLAGGITVKSKDQIKPYLEYVIKEHKKRNPGIAVIDDYVGLKRELVQKKEKRNYLYHINQHTSKIWSVVLGKFTLAFSMAPEFYRRVYNKNPTVFIKEIKGQKDSALVSKTTWQEILDK